MQRIFYFPNFTELGNLNASFLDSFSEISKTEFFFNAQVDSPYMLYASQEGYHKICKKSRFLFVVISICYNVF